MYIVLAVAIVGASIAYHRDYVERFRVRVEQQLGGIAALKVSDLERYRKERLLDAAVLFRNPAFSELVRRYLEQPTDRDARSMLQSWLTRYPTQFEYASVVLLDKLGTPRLSIPEVQSPDSGSEVRLASEVLANDEVVFRDFYRDEHDQRVYCSLLIPIVDAAEKRSPLGVIVLKIDPYTHLYPFISRWPTPSTTAETLLVRRDGDHVLFLNELRFRKDTALNFRIPLRHTDTAAVKAVLGTTGSVEGHDYRGVPVIAHLAPVAQSPWFMVTRMDQSEVYAPLTQRLQQLIGLVMALLLGAGAGLGFLWRQRSIRYYRRQAAGAATLQALSKELEVRVQIADVFLTCGDDDMYVEVLRVVLEATRSPVGVFGYIDENAGLVIPAGVTSAGDAYRIVPTDDDWLQRDGKGGRWSEAIREKKPNCCNALSIPTNGPVPPKRELCAPIMLQEKVVGLFVVADRDTDYTDEDVRVLEMIAGYVAPILTARLQRQRHEADLQRRNAELLQFNHTVSHDLKSPLVTVNTFLGYLEKDIATQAQEAIKQDFEFIRNATVKMSRLLDELLELAKVGHHTNSPEEVALKDVVREALQLTAGRLSARQIHVEVTDEPLILFGDRPRLIELFQNLIDNAAKFMSEQATPRISISVQSTRAGTVFCVRDNGIGIDPRHQSKLFGLFEKLDAHTEGCGMGLALAQKIVTLHGGKIWLESDGLGTGTTFKFTLARTRYAAAGTLVQ